MQARCTRFPYISSWARAIANACVHVFVCPSMFPFFSGWPLQLTLVQIFWKLRGSQALNTIKCRWLPNRGALANELSVCASRTNAQYVILIFSRGRMKYGSSILHLIFDTDCGKSIKNIFRYCKLFEILYGAKKNIYFFNLFGMLLMLMNCMHMFILTFVFEAGVNINLKYLGQRYMIFRS